MGVVQSLTAARMLAIEAASVVAGVVRGDNLWLVRHDGSEFDAGSVRGAKGASGATPIINGRMQVNQRGFSTSRLSGAAPPGTREIGIDRWEGASVYTSPATSDYNVETAPPGILPESASTFISLVTAGAANAVSDYAFFQQRIENARTLSGKQVTVSFWAKTIGFNKKVSVQFIQHFGSGGTPSAAVTTSAGQVYLTDEWTRYSVTVTLPSVGGKTFGTSLNDYLGLRFWVSAGSSFDSSIIPVGIQSDTFSFWGVQLEEGPEASDLVYKSFAQDLRDCQRYYFSQGPWLDSGTILATGFATSASVAKFHIPFPVPMRKIPTLTSSNLSAEFSNGDGTQFSSIVMQTTYEVPPGIRNYHSAGIRCSGGVGMAADKPLLLTILGTGYLTFAAEL